MRAWSWFVVVALMSCGSGSSGAVNTPPPDAPPDAPPPDDGDGPPTLELVAGSIGGPGTADGPLGTARLGGPARLAFGRGGTLYMTDSANHTVRAISADGVVSTLAGRAGVAGFRDGTGAAAGFNHPDGIAVDSAGNLFVSDFVNHTIRKVTTDGVVTTFAGAPDEGGGNDGPIAVARFSEPAGLAIDSADNLYVADLGNDKIRKITPDGTVSTIAGGAGEGSVDGAAASAQFFEPDGVAVGADGTVYVADSGNHTVRAIAGGVVSTLAGAAGTAGTADGQGPGARFNIPVNIAIDRAGILYVSDANNDAIRRVTPAGAVTTFAGRAGVVGSADGNATSARFSSPGGAAFDGAGALFVADGGNSELREVTAAGDVSTVLGSPAEVGSVDGAGPDARFGVLGGIAVDHAGTAYIVDTSNNTLRRIDTLNRVATIAGAPGVMGSDDGLAASARFSSPEGVAVNAAGDVFVTDFDNSTIRALTGGEVSTYAGNAFVRGSQDGANASFDGPNGITIDAAGNLYVTDFANEMVRSVARGTRRVTTLAGSGLQGSDNGASADASFNAPAGLAVDGAGNLYIADSGNSLLRKRAADGTVSTIADSTTMHLPICVAIDGAGNLYVSNGDATIRKVATDGTVTTIAGTPGETGVVLGTSPRLAAPNGLAIVGDSLLITDGHAVLRLRHVVR